MTAGPSAVAAPPEVVERDPNERLQEVLDYLSMSYELKSGWHGTAVFDIPKASTNPNIIFWIRCDAKNPARHVTSGYGLPPDGKYDVYTTMNRDDFFYLYSGRAGPGAVSSMVLTGRLKVKWLKFDKLASFAASFCYTTSQWIKFYNTYGRREEADVLMRTLWAQAEADPSKIVTPGGDLVDVSSVPQADVEAWRAEGARYLKARQGEGVAGTTLDAAATSVTEEEAPATEPVPAPESALVSDRTLEGGVEVGPPAAARVEEEEEEEAVESELHVEPAVAGTPTGALEPAAEVAVAEVAAAVPALTDPVVLDAAPPSDSASALDASAPAHTAEALSEGSTDKTDSVVQDSDAPAPFSAAVSDAAAEAAPAEHVERAAEAAVLTVTESAQEDESRAAQAAAPTTPEAKEDERIVVTDSQSSQDEEVQVPPGLPVPQAPGDVDGEPAVAAREADSLPETMEATSVVPPPSSAPQGVPAPEMLPEAVLEVGTTPPDGSPPADVGSDGVHPPDSPLSPPLSESDIRLDMLMLLPDLLSQPTVSVAALGAAGLRVVSAPPPSETPLSVAFRSESLPSSLEHVYRKVEGLQAKAAVVDAALFQLRADRQYLDPLSPASAATSTLEAITSSIGGFLKSIGESLSKDDARWSAQVQEFSRREEELLAKRSGLSANIETGLHSIERSLSSVHRGKHAGLVLSLVAVGGFLHPPGEGDAVTAAAARIASQVTLEAVLSSGAPSLLSATVGAVPAWLSASIAAAAGRQRALRPSRAGPGQALAGLSSLFSFPHARSGEGVSSNADLRAVGGLGVAVPLPPAAVTSLEEVTRAWVAAGREGAGAQASSRRDHPGGSGPWSYSSDPESALTSRLEALRQLTGGAGGAGVSVGVVGAPPASPPAVTGAAVGVGGFLESLYDALPSILEPARTEGSSSMGGGGREVSLRGEDPRQTGHEASPPPEGGTEDSSDAAWLAQLRTTSTSLAARFPACHPLTPLSGLVSVAVAAVGGGRGAYHPAHPTSTAARGGLLLTGALAPARLPWYVPSFLLEEETWGGSSSSPTLLSSTAAALLSRLRPEGALVWDVRHAETAAWCMGAHAVPFTKPPVTYGAVEVGTCGGSPSTRDVAMTLLPLWRPKQLACAQPQKGRAAADAGLPRDGLHSGAPLSVTMTMRDVLSPWRMKTYATVPSVYNGVGSGVYASTARERMRLQYEGEVSSAAAAAAAAAAADGTPHTRRPILLRRGTSKVDEASFVWGHGDETLQAAGSPLERMFEPLAPGKLLQDLARKFRDAKILKVYARSHPLSVYTADSEEAETGRGRGRGRGATGPHVSEPAAGGGGGSGGGHGGSASGPHDA